MCCCDSACLPERESKSLTFIVQVKDEAEEQLFIEIEEYLEAVLAFSVFLEALGSL